MNKVPWITRKHNQSYNRPQTVSSTLYPPSVLDLKEKKINQLNTKYGFPASKQRAEYHKYTLIFGEKNLSQI